jgi:hypothetical protein
LRIVAAVVRQGPQNVVVTAGTLDEDPVIKPLQSVFWESRPSGFAETCELEEFGVLPPKK